MRIGMVCPYSFDVHGGVQSHVLQLAEVMRDARSRRQRAGAVVAACRAARLRGVRRESRSDPVQRLGRAVALRPRHTPKGQALADRGRVRRAAPARAQRAEPVDACAAGRRGADRRDVSHVDHEVVDAQRISGLLRPYHEKIVGRIAVSDLARRWQMEALGSDAVQIPNGVDVDSFASAPCMDGYPRPGKSVLFLGRFDEPRKGMDVLIGALPALVERFPDIEILIVGRGDEDELREEAGQLAGHLRFLGQVDDAEKASAMRSADVYCAPNTGGESFGIVLVEAMAAGTAVVASDLDAFRRVLEDGKAGRLVPVDDVDGLAAGLIEVLERRRGARPLHRRRSRGGPPIRLVGGGRPDHAGVRDRRGGRGEGAGGGHGGQERRRQERSDWGSQLGELASGHGPAGAAGGAADGGRVGVSDRTPAGPAARPIRPVMAGTRQRAGPPRRGGACRRRRRLRRGSGGQAARGAGRRRRAGTQSGQGGSRERAVGGARARRPGVPAGARSSPNWPTPRRG